MMTPYKDLDYQDIKEYHNIATLDELFSGKTRKIYSMCLFDMITSPDNTLAAYYLTRQGKHRYKQAAAKWAQMYTVNNEQLRQEIIQGSYVPRPYTEFTVYEPKERIIHAPIYRDKIVQHMVNNVLYPFYHPTFIRDTYACIRGRGNLYAVKRLQRHLRGARENFPDPYLVKADVQRFFYTIDRFTLLNILAEDIRDPQLMALLQVIIESSPGSIGLPLGNLTSQLFANVLMSKLDHFIKSDLGVKYYLRYADDTFTFATCKGEAHDLLWEIKRFTQEELHLTMHPTKSFIKPVQTQPVDGLGFKIQDFNIRLKSESFRRIKKRLSQQEKGYTEKRSYEEIEQSINGWLNHARTGNSEGAFLSLVDRYDWLEAGDNGLFCIQQEILERRREESKTIRLEKGDGRLIKKVTTQPLLELIHDNSHNHNVLDILTRNLLFQKTLTIPLKN